MKKDLYAAREKNGIFLSAENFAGMETKIRSQQELIKELEDKITAYLEEIAKVFPPLQYYIISPSIVYH